MKLPVSTAFNHTGIAQATQSRSASDNIRADALFRRTVPIRVRHITNALESHGSTPALVPREHVAEGLFAALNDLVSLDGMRILIPQANLARPVLADLLHEAGASVDAVVAYDTVRPEIDPGLLAQPVDAITFTSPSTVQHFVESFDDPRAVLGGALVACIGPVSADAARAVGLEPDVVADPYTVEGLIVALEKAFERTSEA